MKNTNYFYPLDIDPLNKFADRIGVEVSGNKIVVIPKNLGEGYIYFLEVAPGISVLFKNYKLNNGLRMNKLKHREDFCLLYYNLEDLSAGKNLWVINKQIEDVYGPLVKESVFSFSLFIDKNKLLKLINELAGSKLHLIEKINNDNGYYSDFIDNKSLILLLSLQKKFIPDPSFDFYIKGVAFKLLANFLEYKAN